jgi:YidC/Oxa1 family membrane protein insertase
VGGVGVTPPTRAPPPPAAQQQQGIVPVPASPAGQPTAPAPKGVPQAQTPAVPAAEAAPRGETVRVTTDLVVAEIDTLGGTLKRLELLKHKDTEDQSKNLDLLGPDRRYEAQSGLAGEGGPNHRTPWKVLPGERTLQAGADRVEVRLVAQARDGLEVQKVYTFKRDSYVIDVALELKNPRPQPVSAYAYFQLTHDGRPLTHTSSLAQSFGAQSYSGFALYSNEHAFEKVSPSDLDKTKEHSARADNGWLAYVQHYFVSAWLPKDGARDYVMEKRQDGTYAGRVLLPVQVAAGGSATVNVPLYSGPQEKRRLESAAPGLELVVDFGWLRVIAWPLFWLLEKFHALSGNWGVAIILLTVLIKIVFFPLSAASYKSMAKMKLITPRMQKMRETYGNDRQKMNQAMMELYRTERSTRSAAASRSWCRSRCSSRCTGCCSRRSSCATRPSCSGSRTSRRSTRITCCRS